LVVGTKLGTIPSGLKAGDAPTVRPLGASGGPESLTKGGGTLPEYPFLSGWDMRRFSKNFGGFFG
jgi:hypothetical protein